ncbi:MAG TPA: L,D-transpeptidase [Longimicrobium sp.]|nr:L,D-transpeptidase [Longimicrobium sp.]
MSRRRARPRPRPLRFLLLLVAVAAGAVVLWRDAAVGEDVAEALLPDSVDAGQALTDVAAADSAVPAKPKRQIVPDVEVVVNIPSGRLQLIAGDSVVRSYPISVGSARYPTPVGSYLLATVIWNPWWHPPPESGWARNRKPAPPGSAGNPMGRVKLHMDELIYIHGTNSVGRLGAPASHGCIRMSNADVVDLARRLHRIADPSVAESRLDALSRPGQDERRTLMARSIRMRVTYDVAELRGDRLHVYPDVYGRAGGVTAQVREELARAGLDTAQVPAPAMTRLRQGAARGGASFALAEIPYLEPLPPLPDPPAASPRERGPRLLGTPVDGPREAPRDTIVIPGAQPDPAPAEPAPPPPAEEPVDQP